LIAPQTRRDVMFIERGPKIWFPAPTERNVLAGALTSGRHFAPLGAAKNNPFGAAVYKHWIPTGLGLCIKLISVVSSFLLTYRVTSIVHDGHNPGGIDGNIGILGRDYPGYFDVGDTRELAQLLTRVETSPEYLAELLYRVKSLAGLFTPAREQKAWSNLINELSLMTQCQPA